MVYSNFQKYLAEFIGTAFLLTTVIGSGIMGESLAGGNVAVALLGNTIATGAILVVLITLLGPVSGAHFNPAVTLAFRLNGDIETSHSLIYGFVQILGAILGVWIAHAMFAQPILQTSETIRAGMSQGFSEAVATFGLVLVILGTVKVKLDAVPMAVGLYITAAYWFTASTSFANPAVTMARALSNTFAGIRPEDVWLFIGMQIISAVIAWAIYRVIYGSKTV